MRQRRLNLWLCHLGVTHESEDTRGNIGLGGGFPWYTSSFLKVTKVIKEIKSFQLEYRLKG